MRITQAPGAWMELDIKRFYIEGLIIESDCPVCGATRVRDVSDDYLSYPVVGKPETLTFYHPGDRTPEGCPSEWERAILLTLVVAEVKEIEE